MEGVVGCSRAVEYEYEHDVMYSGSRKLNDRHACDVEAGLEAVWSISNTEEKLRRVDFQLDISTRR